MSKKEKKYYKIALYGVLTGIVVWAIDGAVRLWLN
jgi:hypothetical protein